MKFSSIDGTFFFGAFFFKTVKACFFTKAVTLRESDTLTPGGEVRSVVPPHKLLWDALILTVIMKQAQTRFSYDNRWALGIFVRRIVHLMKGVIMEISPVMHMKVHEMHRTSCFLLTTNQDLTNQGGVL
jgi:hypothetical protein